MSKALRKFYPYLRAPLSQYNVGAPMERLAIDILGPLPQSKQGNKYILIAANYFTKWVEAYPLVNQEAVTVAEVLIPEFISRFEVPLILHSDQGWNFQSAVSQMCFQRCASCESLKPGLGSRGISRRGATRVIFTGILTARIISCHSWRLHIQVATNICTTMIPSTPVGMLSGSIKTMRSIGRKQQYKSIFGIANSRNL